jgi:hypothetical protein
VLFTAAFRKQHGRGVVGQFAAPHDTILRVFHFFEYNVNTAIGKILLFCVVIEFFSVLECFLTAKKGESPSFTGA